jgi:hypothetical protein
MLILTSQVLAHVSSPDIYYAAYAGSYQLLVTVHTPQAIPGVAQVEIRCTAPDLKDLKLSVRPIGTANGNRGVSSVQTTRVENDQTLYKGEVWVAMGELWQLRIQADGTRGAAEVSVPFAAQARRPLPIQKAFLIFLIALMIFLLITVVGFAIQRGKIDNQDGLKDLATVNPKRRMLILLGSTTIFLLALFYLSFRWWNSEAGYYQLAGAGFSDLKALVESDGKLILKPGSIAMSNATTFNDLVPDHNHLMHLFLIRVPQMDRLYHLHPELTNSRTGSAGFESTLPSLPAGRYQLFADVVHRSGFSETMTTQVDLPDILGQTLTGDDSEWDAQALAAPNNDFSAPLGSGGRMVWLGDASPLIANRAYLFRFRVEDEQHQAAKDMELYMGMAAHAVFISRDRAVFAHVHPSGNIPMATLAMMANTSSHAADLEEGNHSSAKTDRDIAQMPSDSQNPHAMHSTPAMNTDAEQSEVSLPYGFSQPGDYRLFVQIKRSGRIETAVFDIRVQ